jgi:hypothetical protein
LFTLGNSIPIRPRPGFRFAHYFRLDGFAERLDEILAGGTFVPMSAVLKLGADAA